jgi:hypothetical protein
MSQFPIFLVVPVTYLLSSKAACIACHPWQSIGNRALHLRPTSVAPAGALPAGVGAREAEAFQGGGPPRAGTAPSSAASPPKTSRASAGGGPSGGRQAGRGGAGGGGGGWAEGGGRAEAGCADEEGAARPTRTALSQSVHRGLPPAPRRRPAAAPYHAFGLIGTALSKKIGVFQSSSLKVVPISPTHRRSGGGSRRR